MYYFSKKFSPEKTVFLGNDIRDVGSAADFSDFVVFMILLSFFFPSSLDEKSHCFALSHLLIDFPSLMYTG